MPKASGVENQDPNIPRPASPVPSESSTEGGEQEYPRIEVEFDVPPLADSAPSSPSDLLLEPSLEESRIPGCFCGVTETRGNDQFIECKDCTFLFHMLCCRVARPFSEFTCYHCRGVPNPRPNPRYMTR